MLDIQGSPYSRKYLSLATRKFNKKQICKAARSSYSKICLTDGIRGSVVVKYGYAMDITPYLGDENNMKKISKSYHIVFYVIISNWYYDYKSEHIRCLVTNQDNFYLIPVSNTLTISLMQTKYKVKKLYQISCNLEKNIQNLDEILVALIDMHNPEDYFELLDKKFGSFIQIIGHEITENNICKWHKQKVNEFPQNSEYKTLLDSCLLSMKINFDLRDHYIKNTHERLNSNDCLMKNRHEYQYISNYDFDEFIFPRSFETDHVKNVNESNICEKNDDIKFLERKYGNKVAYFQFENVNMLIKHEIIMKILKSNETQNLEYSSSGIRLRFTSKNSNDQNLLNSFKQNIWLFDCMNKTIFQNSDLNPKWNNYIGALVNNRAGKSIYNTDYTLSYNQHFAWTITKESRKVSVPLKVGYVSHFRDIRLESNISGNFNKFYDNKLEIFTFEKMSIDSIRLLHIQLILLMFCRVQNSVGKRIVNDTYGVKEDNVNS
ncbi:hypothetical protein BpHYR1_011251 [Brachionus plicatilis]|uniref:Glycosyltransferase family 92 protein n=1 Tax=Brachionus plicatilis TaxID=10195 RepID=A0A3M7RCP3_BRAPC|nr:hypothetical protein BpHYR1_011251 [Brachionus plicatilis]